MWRDYLTAGFRAMLNNRVYTAINVTGLALGIAAATLVFLYVRHESTYDAWLADAERIHVLQTRSTIMGPDPVEMAATPRAAVEALPAAFSEIEASTALTIASSTLTVGNEPVSARILLADEGFFDMFDLPLVRGDKRTALVDPASLLVTETEAIRLFGVADPIGRTVDVTKAGVTDAGRTRTLRVTGVLADLPDNSHLDLGLVARADPAAQAPGMVGGWAMRDSHVYLRLRPGADPAAVNARLPAFERTRLGPLDKTFDFRLVPIRALHLGPPVRGSMKPVGDALAVKAFTVVAAMILLIACFNFTNLATAKASQRAREVGLRKVLGARRSQLITQFMAESILFASVGTLIGLALVEITLPWFNTLLGTDLALAYAGSGGILLPALALTIAVGAVSGAYPAFYLSGFRPERVLRPGALHGASGSGRLRNGLVVGQFAIAIGLISSAAIVHAQTMFARTADPGFDPRNLLVVENLRLPDAKPQARTLRDEVASLPGVVAASLAGDAPTGRTQILIPATRAGAEERVNIQAVAVDRDLFGTLGARLIAGRALSDRFAGDLVPPEAALPGSAQPNAEIQASEVNIVINRATATAFGFATPDAAIGQELNIFILRGTIVGVIEDLRYGSLREATMPTVYARDEAGFSHLIVRYSAGTDPEALRAEIGRVWRNVAGETPFKTSFVADAMAEHYDADAVRGQVFAIASALAVLIACLGLFGLAAFTVERRKLEIAVRKVFGAGNADIVRLMAWQFSKPVMVANLIAWPAAWWLMRDWLNGFAERIELHAGWFLGAGALALLLAVLTVAGHSLRVARANPIHALRYE